MLSEINVQPRYYELATKYSRFENWVVEIRVSHEIPSLADGTPKEMCYTFSVYPISRIPSVILKIKHTWTARKADVETWFPVMKGEYIKPHTPPPPSPAAEWQRAIEMALSESGLERKDGHSLSLKQLAVSQR